MALNITTDYAVRIMLYMASNQGANDCISGKEISSNMHIPYNYFLKIITNLKNAGFLISYQGKKGGYALVKDPKDISIYDIINAMGDSLTISECLKNPAACSRNFVGQCAVHNLFESIQQEIEQRLQTVSVADVIEQQGLLDEILNIK